MGLLDLFSKLVVEHGSAEVQGKHIALFKDQLALADKRILELEAKVMELESKLEKSKATIQELTKDNEELRSKIQEYEQPTEEPTHNNLLDEVKMKLLSHLLNHEKSLIPQIAQALNIGVEAAKFHVQDLKSQRFIKDGFARDKYGSVYMNYSLDQAGRRYLHEQGMLT